MKDDIDNTQSDKFRQRLTHYENYYRVIDKSSGKIVFHQDHPHFKSAQKMFASIGSDSFSRRTEKELHEKHHARLMHGIYEKNKSKAKSSLKSAFVIAFLDGNREEAAVINRRLKRRKALGLKVIK